MDRIETGRIGDVAGRLVKRRASRKTARAVDDVHAAWAVAGRDLARTTCVRSLREGLVTVTVASAPLCHELAGFRCAGILAALNAALASRGAPPVKALRFRIGSV